MSKRARPLGLRLLVALYWFWAGAIGLALLGFAFGEGAIVMEGEEVSRPEALSRAAPMLIPAGAAVVGAALGLTLGRRWARPAALIPFLLLGIAPSLRGGADRTPMDLVIAAAVVLPIVAVLVWYLYFSSAVAAYYAPPERSRPDGQA